MLRKTKEIKENKKQFEDVVMKRVTTSLLRMQKLRTRWLKSERKKAFAMIEKGEKKKNLLGKKKEGNEAATFLLEKMDLHTTAMEEVETHIEELKKELERIQEHNNVIVDNLLTLTKKQYTQLILAPDGYKSIFLYKNDPIVAATQQDGPF